MVWTVIFAGLVAAYLVVARKPLDPPAANPFQNLVAIIPLFVSIVVRWLVLPRYSDAKRAFPMFVAGLALAEACGYLGLFTGGPYRQDFVLLSSLGIIQYMPFYARRLA